VIGARFSDAERAQVSRAAVNSKLTLSAFVREAALASSAVVVGKASVQASEPPERERQGVVLVDPEQSSHAFVDGICKRCGVDVDGRDPSCCSSS
jgi:hypothetical protein